jgi:hypothetical protein
MTVFAKRTWSLHKTPTAKEKAAHVINSYGLHFLHGANIK